MFDHAEWLVSWKVEKYIEDIDSFVDKDEFYSTCSPYSVIYGTKNGLSNAGIDELWDLVCGTGTPDAFSNANAAIGVGSSSTAFAASQTNLQGGAGAAVRSAMDPTYPQTTTQTATFRASFGSGVANFPWNEWGIFNDVGTGDPPTGGVMLNRKVESLGVKAGDTWVLTVSITIG